MRWRADCEYGDLSQHINGMGEMDNSRSTANLKNAGGTGTMGVGLWGVRESYIVAMEVLFVVCAFVDVSVVNRVQHC